MIFQKIKKEYRIKLNFIIEMKPFISNGYRKIKSALLF